jgi:hypothetical protein
MSEKTVLKQFFKFDKHIFPPASAPIRRGLAIGVSISLLFIVVASATVALATKTGVIAFSAYMTLIFVGLPWTMLFDPDSLLAFSLCILVNGLILGIIIGVTSYVIARKFSPS